MTNRVLIGSMAVVAGLYATDVHGAVAYYRFEDNLTSQTNTPLLNATAGSTAGYSTDVPGQLIVDPFANTSVANTRSYNHGTGTASVISDHATLNDAVSSGSFTIEAFIKIDSAGPSAFDLIVGNMNGAGTQGWLLGLDANGRLRFAGVQTNGSAMKVATSSSAVTTDAWHHVAAVGVFTERTGDGLVDFTDVTLYIDYAPASTAVRYFGAAATGGVGISGPNFVNRAENFGIGAINPFSGLIDELRISDSPLQTSQMLTAQVPEPGVLGLAGMMSAGLLMHRRRKNA